MDPRSATAMTEIAPGIPSAVSRVPSIGSTATSTSGPKPAPTRSLLKSIGASSFSPSPITTMPCIVTVLIMRRIGSTAAASAAFLSPRPIQRAAPIAADSVTRTSSSARFRSGTVGSLTLLTDPLILPRRPPRWHDRRLARAPRRRSLRRARGLRREVPAQRATARAAPRRGRLRRRVRET